MQAVNPKSTTKVNVGGVEFTVGIIPYGKKLEIEASGYARAMSGSATMTEQEALGLMKQSLEYVRWGIRGHAGFTVADGSPVPFIGEKVMVGGHEIEIVSQETLEIYGATKNEMDVKGEKISLSLISALSGEVSKFNYSSEAVVKN